MGPLQRMSHNILFSFCGEEQHISMPSTIFLGVCVVFLDDALHGARCCTACLDNIQ